LPAGVDTSFSNDADEEDSEGLTALAAAPDSFCPKGWILFKMRGVMAPIESRLDMISLSKPTRKGGRKASRAEDREEKSIKRDQELGSGGGRGLSYGASSQKDVAVIAQPQQQSRINNQKYEAEIDGYAV